jgi:hypothetical protein
MQEKGSRVLSFSTVAKLVFPSFLQLLRLIGIVPPHSSLLNQLCYILHFANTIERYYLEFRELLKLAADHLLSHPVSGTCHSSDLQTPLYTFWNMNDPSLVLQKYQAFERVEHSS